jgi:putative transposase
MTPKNSTGISKVMQFVGRRYVQYINKQFKRSSTLFEGRFKSSLVDAESYFLAGIRYIELNPVRANMVVLPFDYRWSSYQVNAGYKQRESLSLHSIYLSLANNLSDVYLSYRKLFEQEFSPESSEIISKAISCSMPLGNNRFKIAIEHTLGRTIGYNKRGRPALKE